MLRGRSAKRQIHGPVVVRIRQLLIQGFSAVELQALQLSSRYPLPDERQFRGHLLAMMAPPLALLRDPVVAWGPRFEDRGVAASLVLLPSVRVSS
eukprot:scaffold803_cov310-Pinguiococcus_pyrenoidosus.AAC.88